MHSWLCYFSAQKSQNVPQYRPREILALPLPLKTLMLWSQTPFQAHLPPCPLHILCFRQTRQLLGPRHSTGFPGFLPDLANYGSSQRTCTCWSSSSCSSSFLPRQYKKYPFSLPFSSQIQKNILSFLGLPKDCICPRDFIFRVTAAQSNHSWEQGWCLHNFCIPIAWHCAW